MHEILMHLIGDYILQSDWMANNKTAKNFACLMHVLTYGIPFALYILYLAGNGEIGLSLKTAIVWLVIVGTHFVIDRFRLAKYICYVKNFLAPPSVTFCIDEVDDANDFEVIVFGDVQPKYRYENCKNTGYPSETPQFLAVWLLIITDNTLHLLINHLALKFL